MPKKCLPEWAIRLSPNTSKAFQPDSFLSEHKHIERRTNNMITRTRIGTQIYLFTNCLFNLPEQLKSPSGRGIDFGVAFLFYMFLWSAVRFLFWASESVKSKWTELLEIISYCKRFAQSAGPGLNTI